MTHLQTVLNAPVAWRAAEFTDERYLRMRQRSAAALARHRVASALRSSRAALYEHLFGTEAARAAHALPDTR